MKLSIVTTLYRSAPYIHEFHARMTAAALQITDDYEIIMVDDGSPDDSLSRSLAIQAGDPHVTVVELSRNFGHHYAIMAGLQHARGGKIFLIDVDLEEDPKWLQDFHDIMRDSAADVVFGVQQERTGGLFNKGFVGLFYKIFNILSDTRIPENPCTVRLMSRNYVDSLLLMKDKNLFLAGNFAWVGFEQKAVAVRKGARKEGSSYSLTRMLKLLFNAIACFSAYPLYLIFLLGIFIVFFSGIFGGSMLVRKFLAPETVQLGWSSLMASIWFLGGLVLFAVGTVGLYLSKVFVESKNRPSFVVKRIHGAD